MGVHFGCVSQWCCAQTACSALLVEAAVKEVEESGGLILTVVVADKVLGFVIEGSASVDFKVIEGHLFVFDDKVHGLSDAGLEASNTVLLAVVLEPLEHSGDVGLDLLDELALLHAGNFVVAESVNHVNDHLGLIVVFNNVIGGNGDAVGALGDLLGLDADNGVVEELLHLIDVREELVFTETIKVDSHG